MSANFEVDIDVLGRTVDRLAEGLRMHSADPDNLMIRDSTIKRFELCYLQCIHVLERFLQDYAPVAPDSDATLREIVDAGRALGLTFATFGDWLTFRKARNKAAHTYLDQVIEEIVSVAGQFLPEAQFLLDNVKRRVGDDAQLGGD